MHERGRVLAYLSSMLRAGAILSASSLSPPYISTLSHKWHGFGGGGGVAEHKMCDLIFYTTFLILRRIQRDIVVNVKTSSCKIPVIFVGF